MGWWRCGSVAVSVGRPERSRKTSSLSCSWFFVASTLNRISESHRNYMAIFPTNLFSNAAATSVTIATPCQASCHSWYSAEIWSDPFQAPQVVHRNRLQRRQRWTCSRLLVGAKLPTNQSYPDFLHLKVYPPGIKHGRSMGNLQTW